MQVFFVSIRTALIYGPGELEDAQGDGAGQMQLHLSWPHSYVFDEWEGYAVVVPERGEVWGLSQPQVEDGRIEVSFPFTPQPIPPQDRKIFEQGPRTAQAPAANDSESENQDD
ncbi:MAG: hypothetical protein CVV27_13530 [Candidatus Melainabacteria bacterium HGW-Melainabacteria-1]|nr:MAG: hypothetical protein CVV27_13530 [Candidatus Melainabacteria bacterium HGW-Melainabacteria-1]